MSQHSHPDKNGATWAAFDLAYELACRSSKPDDWMEAALLAQQIRSDSLRSAGRDIEPNTVASALRVGCHTGLVESGSPERVKIDGYFDLRTIADYLSAKASARSTVAQQVEGRPRGAYEPLTVEQIDRIRVTFQAFSADAEQAKRLTTLCDMAINCLLYGEEIHRLRHDLSRAMENHNADLNAAPGKTEEGREVALPDPLTGPGAAPGTAKPNAVAQHHKDFFDRHAKGSLLCPSCLLCGHQRPREEWSVRHAELPDIYICKTCVDAARSSTGEHLDTARLNYLARSLHIDATGDEPVWGLFIHGSEPFIREPWELRRLIDEAMKLEATRSARKEP